MNESTIIHNTTPCTCFFGVTQAGGYIPKKQYAVHKEQSKDTVDPWKVIPKLQMKTLVVVVKK